MSYKIFNFKNFTIRSDKVSVSISFENNIGIFKSYKFSKLETPEFKHCYVLHNHNAKSKLYTTYLYSKKESHDNIIQFINTSFDLLEYKLEEY
jgi:hypothetical protein